MFIILAVVCRHCHQFIVMSPWCLLYQPEATSLQETKAIFCKLKGEEHSRYKMVKRKWGCWPPTVTIQDLQWPGFWPLWMISLVKILILDKYKQAENGLQSRSSENGSHGLSWIIIDYHGLSWTVMDYHGLSLMTKNNLGWPRTTKVDQGW